MPIGEENLTALGVEPVGDVRRVITSLAWMNGIYDEQTPFDTFADAVNRLCGEGVAMSHHERLLFALCRKGVITSEESFALHAAYLVQGNDGV